jgi:NDP-sugar pyrophosphorylase family protein
MTDTIPKALVTVGGKPMLEHLLLKMKAAGFTHIIINIHHFGEQIIDCLASKNNFGMTSDISGERDYLLDTGGGIKQASCFLNGNEPFLVHNVDIFSNVDLCAMNQSHLKTNALATLLVSNNWRPRQLLFNQEALLCGWRNRDTGDVRSFLPDFDPSQYEDYAFGGVHVISPTIFPLMDEWRDQFSIISFYLKVCIQNPIRLYTEDELCLIDAGTVKGIQEVEEWLM